MCLSSGIGCRYASRCWIFNSKIVGDENLAENASTMGAIPCIGHQFKKKKILSLEKTLYDKLYMIWFVAVGSYIYYIFSSLIRCTLFYFDVTTNYS